MKLSTTPKLVCVFGGSGFVGRHVVRELADKGYQIRVAVRRPDLAGFLQPLGNVGQIQFVQANVRYQSSVMAAVRGADAVINLVGTFDSGGRNNFDAVQAMGAGYVAQAAKDAGARMIHVSAIGADEDSSSGYGVSKAEGEKAVLRHCKKAVVLRPSVMFGPEDDFFNRFGAMARISPFLPLIGGGSTKFQPVYVGDVAQAIVKAVGGELKSGKIYELGGPQIVTFKECLQLLMRETARPRTLISIPYFAATVIGRLVGWVPGAPITADQVEMLKTDNVVGAAAIRAKLTLESMGINPTPMGAILPTYLVQYRPHGQFTNAHREEN